MAQLAAETNLSMAAVLEAALENYRRSRLLAKAAAAYEALASDPGPHAEYRSEIAEFDGVCGDGLERYEP